jgi:flagellar assembly protein FliH
MAEVIKAHAHSQTSRGNTAPRPSPFNFSDLGDRADAYLEQVRQQAQTLLENARQEAEQIHARAKEEGRQAALAAAEASLKKHVATQLQRVLPALESAGDLLLQANGKWQQEWNRRLVELATAIASRVIRREVRSDVNITLTWVREALELGMASPTLELRLHPDDHQLLAERAEQLTARLAKAGTVRVIADDTIPRGGCRVHSDFGVIDQTVEAQLQRIAMELE